MADLISRAAAIDALTNMNLKRNFDSVCDGDMNRTRRAAQRVIAQLPTVDAVPVVRCKDCKHCYGIDNDPMTPYDGETDWYCEEFDADWPVLTLDPNRFYCANGERRNE